MEQLGPKIPVMEQLGPKIQQPKQSYKNPMMDYYNAIHNITQQQINMHKPSKEYLGELPKVLQDAPTLTQLVGGIPRQTIKFTTKEDLAKEKPFQDKLQQTDKTTNIADKQSQLSNIFWINKAFVESQWNKNRDRFYRIARRLNINLDNIPQDKRVEEVIKHLDNYTDYVSRIQ